MLVLSDASQTEYHAIKVLGEPPGVFPSTKPTLWPAFCKVSTASRQLDFGGVPLMFAEVAVSGPVARSSAFATG